MGLLGLGAALVACGGPVAPAPGPSGAAPSRGGASSGAVPSPDLVPPAPVLPPRAGPGGSVVLRGGPPEAGPARRIALTVDDGFCADCVSGYVAFAQRSGVHLTFSPNGRYAPMWEPQAATLRPLIEAGQVQLMNHTYQHRSLPGLPPGTIRGELERNEEWVGTAFGTSTAPYYRPPYGRHTPAVDEVAAGVGFDRVVLWDGSYSDSELITPQFLMAQARRYLAPGVILLGHANHPTVLGLFDQILDLLEQRALTTVTIDELFGTRRPPPRR